MKIKKTYNYTRKDNENYIILSKLIKTYLTLYKVEKYLEKNFSNSRNKIQKLNTLCVFIYLEKCCIRQAKIKILLSKNYGNLKKT
jgi:hypothetical protein